MTDPSQVLTVTATAAERVKKLLATQDDAKAIRVGVRQMGCSDMSYTMDFAQDSAEDDIVVERDGASLFVDPDAIPYINGSELDWVEEKLASRFVFNNPNVVGACGCGESFKVADQD
ncbi:MAG: iron-sulfur cluster assembly accessory protein [Alphaproteobacteria bacterium]